MATVNKLADKYARLLGQRRAMTDEIVVLEAVIKRLRWVATEVEKLDQSLDAIAHTATLFDPSFNRTKISPVRPQRKTFSVGSSGYIRAALRVLRTAEQPMTAGEIADEVHEMLGLPDRTAWKTIRASIQGSLQRYADRGLVHVQRVKPLRYSIHSLPG